MKLVSVIIPTYNRAEMLCKCVDSILNSTYDNLEVIIVDNNSSDETRELVESKYAADERVLLISLKENLMAAGGRNEGIKRAKGEYLLLVDNDNIVERNMIELLVAEMSKDKKIGLVLNHYQSISMMEMEYGWQAAAIVFFHQDLKPYMLEKRFRKLHSSRDILLAIRRIL